MERKEAVMRRIAVSVVVAVVGAVLVASAAPASAKGEGRGMRLRMTITGPGLHTGGSGPGSGGVSGNGGSAGEDSIGTIDVVVRDDPEQSAAFWQLAGASLAFTGRCLGCLTGLDTTPPHDLSRLGPAYRVVYLAGRCCTKSAVQAIYPFAPGGPWVDLERAHRAAFFGDGRNGLPLVRTGWLHLAGFRGAALLDILHRLGVPRKDPMLGPAGSAAPSAVRQPATGGWRIATGLAGLIALLVLGAATARPRRAGKPA